MCIYSKATDSLGNNSSTMRISCFYLHDVVYEKQQNPENFTQLNCVTWEYANWMCVHPSGTRHRPRVSACGVSTCGTVAACLMSHNSPVTSQQLTGCSPPRAIFMVPILFLNISLMNFLNVRPTTPFFLKALRFILCNITYMLIFRISRRVITELLVNKQTTQ